MGGLVPLLRETVIFVSDPMHQKSAMVESTVVSTARIHQRTLRNGYLTKSIIILENRPTHNLTDKQTILARMQQPPYGSTWDTTYLVLRHNSAERLASLTTQNCRSRDFRGTSTRSYHPWQTCGKCESVAVSQHDQPMKQWA